VNNSDNDDIPDTEDNCPNTSNSQQLDADEDGVGDVCDTAPGCGGWGIDTISLVSVLDNRYLEVYCHAWYKKWC
jgi:hypothetical protein